MPYDPATPEDLEETVTAGARRPAAGSSRPWSTPVTIDGLRKAVDDGVAELGRLDIIVANAGITAPQTWDEITPEDFRDVMDINVTGTWNTVMAGAQNIIDGGRGGSIILISSAAGIKMQPFMIHYTASKHAVTGMARAFAAELGKHSIRVNSVHPGPVDTAMGSGRHGRARSRTTHGDQSAAGPHGSRRSCPTWVAAARGHRRRRVLAGQRRVEIRHRAGDLGRPGLDPVLT